MNNYLKNVPKISVYTENKLELLVFQFTTRQYVSNPPLYDAVVPSQKYGDHSCSSASPKIKFFAS